MTRYQRAFLMLPLLIALSVPHPVNAATFKCRGFSFLYTEIECEQPTPPATAGAMFCRVYTPVRWAAADTRGTKEQVDSLNRIWKRLCAKK